MSNPFLLAALDYAMAGMLVFPLAPGVKVPRKESHGLKDATTDPDQIRRWWQETPHANVGGTCGAESGIVVLDLDLYKPGAVEARDDLLACYGPLPETRVSYTPHGGQQWFFQHPGDHRHIPSSTAALGLGIDIRGDGGYVVLPPSRLSDARAPYLWGDAGTEALAPLPHWLLALVVEPDLPEPSTRPETPTTIREGQRNWQLFRMGCAMRRVGFGPEAIVAALREHNRLACEPPLTNAEVCTIAKSCTRYLPQGGPPDDPWLGPRSEWHGVPAPVWKESRP